MSHLSAQIRSYHFFPTACPRPVVDLHVQQTTWSQSINQSINQSIICS